MSLGEASDGRNRGTHTEEVCGVNNGFCTSTRTPCARIRRPRPVATKSRVQDQGVIVEMCTHITRTRGPERNWCPPKRWVRFFGFDVYRNGCSGKVPHFNTIFIPKVRIHAAGNTVEAFPIGCQITIDKPTASVVVGAASALLV